MEEIKIDYKYNDFKNMLDIEFKEVACGFIRIGYLLKIARDTEILTESGYNTVTEFAQAEYGLTKDIVSRYIAINDRYSENGYSDQIAEQYKQYGVAKLAEMLTLPDSIIEEIHPSLTRREIQELKNEIREENKISDIEVLMEEKTKVNINFEDILDEFTYEYLKNKEVYEKVKESSKLKTAKEALEVILDSICPSGIGMITARIAGKGKYALSIKGLDDNLTLVNLRSNEKQTFTWPQLYEYMLCLTVDYEYTELYGVTEEVAPVQPEEEKKEQTESIQESSEEQQDDTTQFYPEPVQMESICYSCKHNSDCGRKTTITTECNEYIDKANFEKTEEQRYSEQQDKIDRETKKKLEQMQDEEKMNNLPSDAETLRKIHSIRLGTEFFEDSASGLKPFELRKNDRDYKVGDWLEMMEFKEGKNTGQIIKAEIIYMLEDYEGLEDGYCILGTRMDN